MKIGNELLVLILLMSTLCFAQQEDEDEEEEDEDMEDMEDDENPPKGHLEPIGNSGISWQVDEVTELPDPITFYEKYVVRSKPVIFRGLAKKYPSFDNLRSDKYLSENYGKWKMFYEKGKKEDRKGNGKRTSFKKFLNMYQRKGIYMVSDVVKPNPLTKEMYVPKPMLCDDITNRVETCIMWLSSGGTKSVLHTDSLENINCLIDGNKEFVMVHRNQRSMIPMNRQGSHSPVDVEKVDLYKYPAFTRMSWYKANVKAGDCLYIPYEWAHHVNSTGDRNLAVNVWWNHMIDLPNKDACKKQVEEGIKDFEPWTNFDRNPNETKRTRALAEFGNEKEPMTWDRFHDHTFGLFDHVTSFNETTALFKQLDTDGDGLIWYRDLYNSPTDIWDFLISKTDGLEQNSVYEYEEVDDKKDEL